MYKPLLSVINREDLDGNVFYAVGDVTFYGFLNDKNEFVELFAESIWGRSHRACGQIHPVPLESLSLCTLEVNHVK